MLYFPGLPVGKYKVISFYFQGLSEYFIKPEPPIEFNIINNEIKYVGKYYINLVVDPIGEYKEHSIKRISKRKDNKRLKFNLKAFKKYFSDKESSQAWIQWLIRLEKPDLIINKKKSNKK